MTKNTVKILLNYRNYLKKLFPFIIGYVVNGELILKVSSKNVKNFIYFLKKHSLSQYKILSDICAVDYIWKKNRFAVVYNLLSILYNTRVTITVFIDEKTPLESISTIHNTASWFEREIWDLFGIFFTQHSDLRRILTDYGFKGHPLRKDFPLTGFIEVRYFNNEKRILAEEVSLAQDYRAFYFNNNWNKTV